MEGEWFPGVPETSQQPQQITFVTMSTVDDLSYSPSEGQKTRDAAQVAATGRRSWKTLKGKPEAVWPPALEGALIEALEEYRKMEARPTTSKYGVRYPMRNRFISDFILEKTGKTRTAKQVGSRLQQLRDTCKDGRLSSLLGKSGSQEPADCKAETSPTPSLGRQLSDSPSPPPEDTMAVYVQLECPSERLGVPASTPQVHLKANDMDTPHYLYLMPRSRHPSDPLPAYPTPSSTLSSFSGFVEVVSPFPLSEETSWTVYKDKTLIHQERTAIRMTSPIPTATGRRVYICELVPSLWPILCETEDPNFITIVQKVRSARESSSLANAVHHVPAKEVSIVYHFNVPDFTKLKLRPATNSYSVSSGHSAYGAQTSISPAPQGHHSRSSFSDYSSSPQAESYWPPPGQDSYTYRESGFSGHRRMHEPSMSPPDPTPPIGSGHYSVDGSRWGQYGDVGAETYPNSFYGEPRATQWEMNSFSPASATFGRRDTLSYNPMNSSCY